jgi:hypothetical protein
VVDRRPIARPRGRGASLPLEPDGPLRVALRTVLTEDDRAFLREHRDEARRIVAYAARMAELPV